VQPTKSPRVAKVSAQPSVLPENMPVARTVPGCASFTMLAICPYSTVPKIESSAKRPMRKPKSPMRLVTNAFRPQNAFCSSVYQKPISR
jgi:hypothetical protein